MQNGWPEGIGQHVEQLAFVVGAVQHQSGTERLGAVAVVLEAVDVCHAEVACICIGTSCEGQVMGVSRSTCWKASLR